jgi:hypothetical protein
MQNFTGNTSVYSEWKKKQTFFQDFHFRTRYALPLERRGGGTFKGAPRTLSDLEKN